MIEFFCLHPKFKGKSLSAPFVIYSIGYILFTYIDRSRKGNFSEVIEFIINRTEHLFFMVYLYLIVILLKELFDNKFFAKLNPLRILILLNLLGIFNEIVQVGMQSLGSFTYHGSMDTLWDIGTNFTASLLIFVGEKMFSKE